MAEPNPEPHWKRAALALQSRAAPMPTASFWAEIANLGWASRRQDPAECGAELARRLAPEQLAGMRLRFVQLEAQLQRSIEIWQLQHEENMGLPLDLQSALREHLIGLGESAFSEGVRGPWRVKHRGDQDDYLEGFGRIFDEAFKRYSPEQLEQALE
jgi:hypothetical protein